MQFKLILRTDLYSTLKNADLTKTMLSSTLLNGTGTAEIKEDCHIVVSDMNLIFVEAFSNLR